MDPRKSIEKLIAKKTQEKTALEEQLASIQVQLSRLVSHIEAHEETLKLFPKESASAPNMTVNLKKGSEMEKTFIFLRGLNRPAHVKEILSGINKEVNQKTIQSIASSLASYSKSGRVFVKTDPYTFGLLSAEPIKTDTNSHIETDGQAVVVEK